MKMFSVCRPLFRVSRCCCIGLILVIIVGMLSMPLVAQGPDVMVFSAGNLKEALEEITAQYQRETGTHVRVSLASASSLAKQIENGAPADIFISADLDWMDYLAKRNLIKSDTRKNLLGNKLVLIAPKDSPVQVRIQPGFPLSKLLSGGKLAICETTAVPCGKYGKASLVKLGLWSSVTGQIVEVETARAALALVARKEAPLGIVYQTDANTEPKVRVVGAFPEDTHPPIIYPIAITSDSTNPRAGAFLAYLESEKVRPIYEKYGFMVLK